MKLRALAPLLAAVLCAQVLAFGPQGHEMVGAIADQRLADTPAAAKIKTLLDNIPLAEAAVLPDKIKQWDKVAPDAGFVFHLPAHPTIEAQLRAFWEANPAATTDPANTPNHHWFHYTDVPLTDPHYADGKVGRSKWDIVHMTRFCVRVLKGDESEQNPRRITKAVAVILLAHFVGDIHQPLHVGAAYFNSAGQLCNPAQVSESFSTQGGNSLILMLHDSGHHESGQPNPKLHGFWDDTAVNRALALVQAEVRKQPNHAIEVSQEEMIQWFVRHEPAQWKLDPSTKLEDCGQAWADDIMPTARAAHERLAFTNIKIVESRGTQIATGSAELKPMPDGVPYPEWAGQVVEEEIHKAGWRLAALLEAALR